MLKKIQVADNHHEVVRFWRDFRMNHPELPLPVVVTFDHHTDICPAFAKAEKIKAEWLESKCWQDEKTLNECIESLHHDEHFTWALESELIGEAWIFAHNEPLLKLCDYLHCFKHPELPPLSELLQGTPEARAIMSQAVNDNFLSGYEQVARWGETGRPWQNMSAARPLILDIDLDYFLTMKLDNSGSRKLWHSYVREAALITVSMEREWVRLLRFAGETFESEDLLAMLKIL